MIKVFEIVARDAPDEVRAQVAAICAGVDPAKFDVSRIDVSPGTTLRELRRLFVEGRPDVVHAHASKSGAAIRAAAKAAGVAKILYSPHGDLLATRALARLIERGAARLGETVAASPAEAEAARRLGGRVVHVVRDAYLENAPEPLAHDDVVVGSSGRMTRARNTDAWVLLAQRLTDSRNGVKCVWIGGGDDEATARTHLANMNLLAKASVTGPLPADPAREKLRGLDLFVQYSRAGAGLGSILGAMALGLPVVASDIPAHRDIVADGISGFLVDGEMSLLERCQQLLDDEPLRRRLGAAGRDRARRDFSRERMIAELSRLYSA